MSEEVTGAQRPPEDAEGAVEVEQRGEGGARAGGDHVTMETQAGPVYCVCRKPDINCFMIGCDCCTEWFHGNCIGVSEKTAKTIRVWYCVSCRDKNPMLEIKYRSKKPKDGKKAELQSEYKTDGEGGSSPQAHMMDQRQSSQANKMLRVKDEEMIGSRSRSRCKRGAGLYLDDDDEEEDDEEEEVFSESELELYEQYKAAGYKDLVWRSEEEEEEPDALRKKAVKVKHVKRREKKPEKKKLAPPTEDVKPRRHKVKQRHRERVRHSERAVEGGAKDGGGAIRQCLGPGCVEPARNSSKYCSDNCGMKLAANRIYEIVPQRIQQWQQSPCVAEEMGRRQLERIRKEQQAARLRLTLMEKRFHELEGIISNAKLQQVQQHEEVAEGDGDDTDLQIFCVSCSHPVNPKVALRHMERCYAKYESQTSFGSMYPTRIEGATRLFCDVYNPHSKTYCKRLQVLCPEHSRDPKIPADEVCGCPLVRDVFEPTGEFCRVSKRKCNKHYCWEKLRRAEVDLERVRVWYKLDELFEQERNLRTAMTNRAGLLALMLHQTIQHDPVTTDLRSLKER
uniref:CXXC-type zinc finger protein 1 n=1 Tax=Gouania willdenowi TaxID=441366 RepID=A0A8C5GTN5_GOUWI